MEPDQLEFERDGVTVVHGAFDASGMVDVLWDGLSRHGFMPDDPSTWDPGLLVSSGASRGFFGQLTKFGRSGPFAPVATVTVSEAITSVLGAHWHERAQWGQPLITFPTPGPWTLPHDGWHVDFPPQASSPMAALRMFAYLAPVPSRGGATLVIVGSHRLVDTGEVLKSRQIRQRLADRSRWFRDLWQPSPDIDRVPRFMDEGATVDGVEVRVVELTGQPGDLVLWHPALIHGPSPNCSDRPRFMLTHTVFPGPATDL